MLLVVCAQSAALVLAAPAHEGPVAMVQAGHSRPPQTRRVTEGHVVIEKGRVGETDHLLLPKAVQVEAWSG
eukprot:948191-Rhodomonas_salina.2